MEKVLLNDMEYEVVDGFTLVLRCVGKTLQRVELKGEDGNLYSAVICEKERLVCIE